MPAGDRPPVRRVVRRRPSLLAELTDEIEPDDKPTLQKRLTALVLLIALTLALSLGVWVLIVSMFSRTSS